MEHVLFEHPHTKDRVEVENTPGELTKIMVRGYVQVRDAPAADAAGDKSLPAEKRPDDIRPQADSLPHTEEK